MNILEKCKLSNFDKNGVKTFLKNNPKAVIIKPYVNRDGEIDEIRGWADLYRAVGGQVILWSITYCAYHHIHFEDLKVYDYLYLCENHNEAKKLYSEWRKLPSTIEKQKEMIEKKITDYESIISSLRKKLTKLDKG